MVDKKTDIKRREEYLALYLLVKRAAELTEQIAEELSKKPELEDLGKDQISRLLRMPCISCPAISDCNPGSPIISIFVCRSHNISAIHHVELLRARLLQRLGAAYKESSKNKLFKEFFKEHSFEEVFNTLKIELLAVRFPGRLRIIYNKFYPERIWAFMIIFSAS